MTTALDGDQQRQGDTWLLELMLTPDGIADPAPLYRRLRDAFPVFTSSNGVVFLSRYDDCRALLRDNRFGSGDDDDGGGMLAVNESDELREFRRQSREQRRRQGTRSLLFLNPPDHTRLRGLVNRAFTPRRIEAMRASITALAEESLDDLAERGEADAIDVLGWVPVNVIGELVGVPRADWAPLSGPRHPRVWPRSNRVRRLDELTSARAAFEEMWGYFRALVAERRRQPADDLISALLEVEEAGDRLTENELISTTILLFSAGMETTQNLIGNGLGALFRNPDEQARLWSDPSLVDSAVEEMLRWDSPVQLDGRQALVDADIAGLEIPERTIGRHPARRRESRPGALRRPGSLRRRSQRGPTAQLRIGHPLLPRREPGPSRGAGDLRRADPAIRSHRAGGRAGPAWSDDPAGLRSGSRAGHTALNHWRRHDASVVGHAHRESHQRRHRALLDRGRTGRCSGSGPRQRGRFDGGDVVPRAHRSAVGRRDAGGAVRQPRRRPQHAGRTRGRVHRRRPRRRPRCGDGPPDDRRGAPRGPVDGRYDRAGLCRDRAGSGAVAHAALQLAVSGRTAHLRAARPPTRRPRGHGRGCGCAATGDRRATHRRPHRGDSAVHR